LLFWAACVLIGQKCVWGEKVEEKDKYLLSSVSNTLQLLKLLSKHDNLGVAEISKLSGFDKASVFRMLYTLEKYDFVEKTPEAKYRLGLKFLYYGSIVADRQNIIEIARPAMLRACERSRLPYHLSVLDGDRSVTISKEEPIGDIRITVRAGMRLPAYCTAMGRILLAYLPEEKREEMAEGYEYRAYSEHSIRSPEQLKAVLAADREKGYDVEDNDRFSGFGSVAVPVLDHRGNCAASLGVVTPADLVEKDWDHLLEELRQTSKEISVMLGH
jgi:DNA-binding IclR family transcriptional regulator